MAIERRITELVWLDAFAITLTELETLYDELSTLFDDEGDLSQSLTVNHASESIICDHPTELLKIDNLPHRITDFECVWFHSDRYLSLRVPRDSTYSCAHVYVQGDDIAWCAGAIATVKRCLHARRVWYRWIWKRPFIPIYMSVASVSFVSSYFADVTLGTWVLTICASIWCLIAICKKWFWPAGFIILQDAKAKQADRRWMMAITIFGVVATVVSILVGVLR